MLSYEAPQEEGGLWHKTVGYKKKPKKGQRAETLSPPHPIHKMLPLHLLIACLFFVVAQVAGNNERHLITFNKINLGNLAALKILMHKGGYTHAHIILNGIRHVNKAVGHFDNWNDAFGHQRSPDSSTAFTTYGGRPLPEEYAGEWYESSFLGTPREPDKKSLDDLEPKKDIIYDIHQVV